MEPGRSFHPPATTVIVQAIYDADSIALLVRWHDMSAEKAGKNGPSLPVPPEEEEEAAPTPAGGARRRERFGDAGSRRRHPAAETRTRSPRSRRAGHPSSPTPSRSRFRRRCRPAPASRTSSSATPRTRWISGSSIWPGPIRSSSPAREARTSRPTTTGDVTGVASYDQGEWSVIFKRPLRADVGRRVLAGRVHAGRLLGLGRVLARARQPARSHVCGTPSTSSRKWSRRPSAR